MKLIYKLPEPTIFKKCYNKSSLFDEVDWSDWESVVDGFRLRFEGWYFEPLGEFPKTGHEAYPVLSAMCALVDVFAHYTSNTSWRDAGTYKAFLRQLDPLFTTDLKAPIKVSRRVRGKWDLQELLDFADVFYTGVRSSLHHHGDLEPYAGMSTTGVLAKEFPGAGRSTDGKRSYSLVVFDPWIFRQILREWFVRFCEDLRKDPRSARAIAFRQRFEEDFGITIP